MKLNKLFSSLLLVCGSGVVNADDMELNGAFTQGGFVKGKLADCISFTINELKGQCDKDGVFIFGFGRDAKIKQQLTVKLGNGDQQVTDIDLAERTYNVQKIEGVAKKYVSPPEKTLNRIKKDNQQIAAARAHYSELIGYQQDFIWPAKGRISGVYGSQRVFNGTPKRPHFGLDIANKTGTEVIAPAEGVIRLAHNDMYYSGGTIILDHGFGISSTFIHLSSVDVTKGQVVKQGDLIGKIGATGRVTGPHLDWRINWKSERLDPAFWVSDGGNEIAK